MSVRIDASDLVDAAASLRETANNAEGALSEQFDGWVDAATEIMRDEIPVDEGELRDSIEVERDGLSAKITPTKRVPGAGGSDHGLAFLLEYGVGKREPNPFVLRTAERAREAAAEFSVGDVL